jgi:hypothetical protein
VKDSMGSYMMTWMLAGMLWAIADKLNVSTRNLLIALFIGMGVGLVIYLCAGSIGLLRGKE